MSIKVGIQLGPEAYQRVQVIRAAQEPRLSFSATINRMLGQVLGVVDIEGRAAKYGGKRQTIDIMADVVDEVFEKRLVGKAPAPSEGAKQVVGLDPNLIKPLAKFIYMLELLDMEPTIGYAISIILAEISGDPWPKYRKRRSVPKWLDKAMTDQASPAQTIFSCLEKAPKVVKSKLEQKRVRKK